jgi:hypothetical protein
MKLLLAVLISFAFQHTFAQDTTVIEKHFSKKQLSDDITYLTATIDKVHPDMYHSIGMQRYRVLIDSVKSIVHDDMTERQAWPAMARLVGALGEGHSTFNYPDSLVNQLKRGSHLLFPVLIREFDGSRLIVRADASTEDKLLPGDQITSINGISAAKLIDTLSGYAGGLKLYRAIDVCRNLITYIYLYNIGSPYKITYLRNGKPATVTLGAISWSEFRSHVAAKAKTLPAIPKLTNYSFSYLDKSNAYLVINSLAAEPDQFKHFLDSCFNKLKEAPTGKLIIDLRRNGGGNSALAETLLGYLTDKPFRMTGGVRWKVSQEYKDQLNERLKDEGAQKMGYYFSATNGSIISDNGGKPVKPVSNSLQYKGKVFVLIGPHTFSSANMLANTIQDYKLATLVGEPSGEPANDYGELIFLKLPNTGFAFSTSTKQFVRANGNVKDRHPVLPEYKIADDPSTPLDEVIEFVKAK